VRPQAESVHPRGGAVSHRRMHQIRGDYAYLADDLRLRCRGPCPRQRTGGRPRGLLRLPAGRSRRAPGGALDDAGIRMALVCVVAAGLLESLPGATAGPPSRTRLAVSNPAVRPRRGAGQCDRGPSASIRATARFAPQIHRVRGGHADWPTICDRGPRAWCGQRAGGRLLGLLRLLARRSRRAPGGARGDSRRGGAWRFADRRHRPPRGRISRAVPPGVPAAARWAAALRPRAESANRAAARLAPTIRGGPTYWPTIYDSAPGWCAAEKLVDGSSVSCVCRRAAPTCARRRA
jgi:hypothetical protein